MTTFDELRSKYQGYSDAEILGALQATKYPDYSVEEIGEAVGYKPAPVESPGIIGRVKDLGISALKGAIAVPEAAVGLADLVTGGYAGKAAEAVGFRPKEAKAILSEGYSDAQKRANEEVQKAEGVWDTVKAVAANPSVLAQTITESVPSMLGGGVVAGGLIKGTRLGATVGGRVAASGIGEGVVGAGSGAEQIRQQTEDGLLTGGQAAVAGLSGVATGALGVLGAKVAKSLGIADVDSMLAGAAQDTVMAKGVTRRILEGAISEGLIEELPQSVQEQVAQNYALGKPLDEGVSQAAVLGTLSGSVMGAGANLLPNKPAIQPPKPPPAPPKEEKPAAPLLLGNTPEDILAAPDADSAIATFTASLTGTDMGALMGQDNPLLTASREMQAQTAADEADLAGLVQTETRDLNTLRALAVEDARKQRELDALQATGTGQYGVPIEARPAVEAAATVEAPTAMQLALEKARLKAMRPTIPEAPAVPEAAAPVAPQTDTAPPHPNAQPGDITRNNGIPYQTENGARLRLSEVVKKGGSGEVVQIGEGAFVVRPKEANAKTPETVQVQPQQQAPTPDAIANQPDAAPEVQPAAGGVVDEVVNAQQQDGALKAAQAPADAGSNDPTAQGLPVAGSGAVEGDGVKVPERTRYLVTKSPAYDGIEPLSVEDADFELEALENSARKGRLTPQSFAQSEIGKRLDAATIIGLQISLKTDPVGTIQALRSHIANKAFNPVSQPNGALTVPQREDPPAKQSGYPVEVGKPIEVQGRREKFTVTYSIRPDGRLTRTIQYGDGTVDVSSLATDKKGDETWVSNTQYERGEYYPVQLSDVDGQAKARDDVNDLGTPVQKVPDQRLVPLSKRADVEAVTEPISYADARAMVAGKTEKPGGVDPVRQIDAGEGNLSTYRLGQVPLAMFRQNEDDRYDGTVDRGRAADYAARDPKTMPPIIAVLSRKSGTLNVLDGGHRITAARMRGDQSILTLVSLKLTTENPSAQTPEAQQSPPPGQTPAASAAPVPASIPDPVQPAEGGAVSTKAQTDQRLIPVSRRGGTPLTPEENRQNSIAADAGELAMQLQNESAEPDFDPKEATQAIKNWAEGRNYTEDELRAAVIADLNRRPQFRRKAGLMSVLSKAPDPRLVPVSQRPASDHVGRNNVPLADGGKPFKTNKAAKDAKKNQPLLRVVRVEGGFALAPKTEAQITAEAKNAKRLAAPRFGNPGVPLAAHEFIAGRGGLRGSERSDMGMEGNTRVGNRFLFASAGGMDMDEATEALKEAGYLKDDASHDDARNLISRSLKTPQYTAEGTEQMAEREQEERRKAFEAEQEAIALAQEAEDNELEIAAAAFEEAMLDMPQGLAQSDMSMEDALLVAGYTQQELENERNQAERAEVDQGPAETPPGNGPQGDRGREGAQGEDQAAGSQSQGLTAPTRADVLRQQAQADAEAARKEQGGDKPVERKVTGDTPDMLNTQGSVFDQPLESDSTPAPAVDRFAAGKALTKEQRRAVLKTLVDVYKAKGAPREMKGTDRNGNERYGYVHSPELFERSDITGAMVRYHVTLPDGKLAHPSELFPDYTQADIDKAMIDQAAAEKQDEAGQKEVEDRATRYAKPTKDEARQSFIDRNMGFDATGKKFAYFEKDGGIYATTADDAALIKRLERGGWKPASDGAANKVGDLVKLTKPGVNGRVNIAGTITKILPDGRLEIRTQQDGYMTVAPSELGHKPTSPPAEPAAQASQILDAANVTGKDRLDILKDVKSGALTPDEVQAAYPAAAGAKPAQARSAPQPPEQALKHAKDLGGRVVWHSGDLALIEGYSLLTGDSVYAAAKGPQRTRVDIASYTGAGFTDQERRNLLEAKRRAVVAAQAEMAANPDGPFRDGALVFGDDIPERVQNVVRGWIPLLGLQDARIVVTTPASGAAMAGTLAGRFRRIGKANLSGDNTNGTMQPLGESDFHVAVRPTTSTLKTLEVLAHELGHIAERTAFAQAAPDVQAAIRQAHVQWLSSTGKGTALNLARSMRALRSGRSTGFASDTPAADASAYWKSFGEWFADQVSRWATTQDKPLGVVGQFFKRLADRLRTFFAGEHAKFLPDATVAQWLDSLSKDVPPVSEPVFSKIQTREDDAGNVAMFARSQPFYSALSQEVAKIPAKAQSGGNWLLNIQGLIKAGKVKADEVEWSGVTDFLKLQEGKVTREQLVQFLDANGVRVEETVLGGGNKPPGYDADLELLSDNGLTLERNPEDPSMVAFMDENGDLLSADELAEEPGLAKELVLAAYRVQEAADADKVPTRYANYQLPGGTNYREVLLTLPAKEGRAWVDSGGNLRGWVQDEPTAEVRSAMEASGLTLKSMPLTDAAGTFKSSHWDQPNVLAHIRVNDRVDVDGKRVLFVEEIQSDWGQAGKKEGFKAPFSAETHEVIPAPISSRDTAVSGFGIARKGDPDKIIVDGVYSSRSAAEAALAEGGIGEGVPRAPFVGKTDAWLSLALKRIVKMAVDEGYDRVAFVNGDQSAARYDLSKQIGAINYEPIPDTDLFEIEATDLNGKTVLAEDEVTLARIEELVGKEIAKKIEAREGKVKGEGGYRNWHRLSGLDLKVGGEGMKAFYDRIVPNTLKDVLRKVGGGAVEKVSFGSAAKQAGWRYEKNEDGLYDIYGPDGFVDTVLNEQAAGVAIYDYSTGSNISISDQRGNNKAPAAQPGFTITPAMREKAAGGLPMFDRNADLAQLEALLRAVAPGRSETAASVRDMVSPLSDKWSIPITVVQRPDQLPVPAPSDARGLYHNGAIYLVASNLNSRAAVMRTLGHEAIAHHGLREMLGDDGFSTMMRQINMAVKAGNPAMRKISEYVRRTYVDEDGKFELTPEQEADEIAARAVEDGIDPASGEFRPGFGWLKGVFAKVVQFLRDLGITIPMSNTELQGVLVNSMRGLEAGAKLQGQGKMAAAARSSQQARGTNGLVAANNAVVGNNSAITTLNRVMRNAGWEVEYVDLDLTAEKPKAAIKVKRNDGRFLIAKVDAQGRASFETFQRERSLRMDESTKGRRPLSPMVDDTFLGRQRFEGARSMLRGMTTYLADNALNPIALSDMRSAWAGVMAGPVKQEGALPAPDSGGALARTGDIDRAWRDLSGMNKLADFDSTPETKVTGTMDEFVLSREKGKQWAALNVREFRKDDGEVVYSSSLEVGSEEFPKGTGAATTMYLQALNIAKQRGMGWMSEGVRSDAAQAIYRRLTEAGVPFKEVDGSSVVDAAALKNVDLAAVARKLAGDRPVPAFARSVVTGKTLPQAWQAPDVTRMDDFLYSIQDKHIDTKRVVTAVRDAIGGIADNLDPYLQEELYHGRAAKATKDFLEQAIRPLMVDMQARGVEMSDFEEYLHNRHAERRNEQVAKVNPNMPDGGSGIKTADARAYLAGLPAAKRTAYQALARRVDQMNRDTRALLVSSGLEKQSTIDAWQAAYGDEYVPLMREEMDNGAMGIGQGFSVRGSSSKRAMGSDKPVANIMANIALQREKAITRAEKRRIGEALYGMVLSAPNPDFWIAVDPALQQSPAQITATAMQLISMGLNPIDAEAIAREPRQRYIDPRTGQVAERINPVLRSADNVLAVRIDGEDKYVFFNAKDERAMRMAKSLKNLDSDQLGVVMGNVAKMTRYFAAVNTQYNPVFGVVNLTRDIQTALLNLQSTRLAGKQAEVMKHIGSALRGIYIDLRDHRAGKTPTSTWAGLFEEFQREGGATGYRDMYANAQERADAITDELKKIKQGKAMEFGRGVFGWLSDYNESMENAVRLATYKVAKEQGMSNQQAASIAKNLTVNFNRKGQVALQAGALYAFFNAAVQGTARLAETMFSGGKLSATGKKIMAGGLLLGSMQALLLAAAGYDDEEPPDFVRERSLVIPIGGDKYVSIPMPLGFHVIPNLARIPTEWALGGFRDTPKRIGQLVGLFADAFNPIGSAGLSLQTLAPTIIDPLAALAENRDWTGKPIAKKDFNSMQPTAGHTRAKDTATPWGRAIAYGVNWVTGGTDYKPGMASPTPDQIDYLIGQATGGVGREVSKLSQVAGSTVSGEELPLYKIPLLGRFVGTTAGQAAESGRFYENLKQIGEHDAELSGLKKDRRMAEYQEYMRDNPEARLVPIADRTYREVSKLIRMKRDALKAGASTERIKMLDQQITARMAAFNQRVRATETRETATQE